MNVLQLKDAAFVQYFHSFSLGQGAAIFHPGHCRLRDALHLTFQGNTSPTGDSNLRAGAATVGYRWSDFAGEGGERVRNNTGHFCFDSNRTFHFELLILLLSPLKELGQRECGSAPRFCGRGMKAGALRMLEKHHQMRYVLSPKLSAVQCQYINYSKRIKATDCMIM